MSQNNIAQIRKSLGMTQDQLSGAIGTTINNLGKLERGERRMNQDWLEKIGAVLGVSPHLLISPDAPKGDDGPPPPWVPSSETLNLFLGAALRALSGDRADEEAIQAAAHAICTALLTLARHPDDEHDEGVLRTMVRHLTTEVEIHSGGKDLRASSSQRHKAHSS